MSVAQTLEQARDAAGLVSAVYDAEPSNTSFEDGIPDAVVPDMLPPVSIPSEEAVNAAWAASEVTGHRDAA